jgi:RNA recognition motif-containing protein
MKMNKRLYVGNMAYGTTEMDLRDHFGQAGEVAEVKVMLDRETGRPRGFAFVEMADDAGAQNAIAQLDGRDLGGRALKVNEAQERSGGGGGAGGRSGGGARQRW